MGHVQSTYECHPQTLFRIFTNPGEQALFRCLQPLQAPDLLCCICSLHPQHLLVSIMEVRISSTQQCFAFADNTGIFRDIKKRGKRRVLELDPAGRKIVEVRPKGLKCSLCMSQASYMWQPSASLHGI